MLTDQKIESIESTKLMSILNIRLYVGKFRAMHVVFLTDKMILEFETFVDTVKRIFL